MISMCFVSIQFSSVKVLGITYRSVCVWFRKGFFLFPALSTYPRLFCNVSWIRYQRRLWPIDWIHSLYISFQSMHFHYPISHGSLELIDLFLLCHEFDEFDQVFNGFGKFIYLLGQVFVWHVRNKSKISQKCSVRSEKVKILVFWVTFFQLSNLP